MGITLSLTACGQRSAKTADGMVEPTNSDATITQDAETEKTPVIIVTSQPTPKQGISNEPAKGLDWKDLPVIPEFISERTIDIYRNGQKLNNNKNAFSVVGDCDSTSSWFLGDFDKGSEYYSLGPYSDLEEIIKTFKGSFDRDSLAVRKGFNTSSVLSTLWADPKICQSNESPLDCEIRIFHPSIVFILLGSNDEFNLDKYENNMREILNRLIDQGIVPILATKADNVEGGNLINAITARLAMEYDIPLWNFWRVVQDLPDHGLQQDETHLTWAHNYFDDPVAMEKAWPWRNLTALQVLDKVLKTFTASVH